MLTLTATLTRAADFSEGGFYYNILDADAQTVEVTWGGESETSGTASYTGEVSIPETVTHEGTTYSVTTVGTYAFYACEGVTKMTIPASIVLVREFPFQYCTNLKEVVFADGNESIYFDSAEETNDDDGLDYPEIFVPFDGCPVEKVFVGRGDMHYLVYDDEKEEYLDNTQRVSPFYCLTTVNEVIFSENISSIPDYICYYCTGLEHVDIPDNITSIGKGSFEGTGLKEITITPYITTIGTYAFRSCTSLEGELIIPDNVTSLGTYAFYGCSGITSVKVGDGVTELGSCVFSSCTSMSEFVFGANVQSIAFAAFSACRALTELTIPESVTSIAQQAFQNCSGLKKVTLPNTIDKLNTYTFSNCTALEEIVLPNILETLSSNVFSGCTSLRYVDLPSTMTKVDSDAFKNCESMVFITSRATTAPATSTTVVSSFRDLDTENVILFVPAGSESSYTTKRSTTNYWMDFTHVETIVEPEDDMKFCEDDIWYEVTSAEELACEATWGGESSSAGTEGYEGEMTLPDKVAYGGYFYSVDAIAREAFRNCTALTMFTIPSTITLVGEYAFEGCTSLTTVIMEDGTDDLCFRTGSLEYTEDGDIDADDCYPTFYGSGLTTVYLGRNLTYQAWNLTKENGQPVGGYVDYHMSPFRESTTLESMTFGDHITALPEFLFSYCSALTDMTIPEQVTEVGRCAFEGCHNMANLVSLNPEPPVCGKTVFHDFPLTSCVLIVPDEGSITSYSTADQWEDFANIAQIAASEEGTKFYVDGIYYEVVSPDDLTCEVTWGGESETSGTERYVGDMTIPEEVEYLAITYTVVGIGSHAFYACNDLTGISFPESVSYISDYAFYGTALSEMNIPETITATLGEGAFGSCAALSEVTLPSTTDTLPAYVFADCTALADITLPETVTTVGDGAFSGCTALASITSLNPTHPSASATAFSGVNTGDCALYVLVGSYDDYSSADVWKEFYVVEMTSFSIETLEATNVGETSATLNAIIIEAYDDPLLEKGFEYGSDNSNAKTVAVEDSSREISLAVEDLSANTYYIFRAYAVMSDGSIVYGDRMNFTTGTDGIDSVSANSEGVEGIYSVGGQKLNTTMKGVNIVRMSDGTTKKVLAK